MNKVLFVCTGNTCRSPLAEVIFEHNKPNENLEAKSAGVFAYEGAPMSEGSRAVLANKGLLENHSAQPVSKHLIDWADVILTMTEGHKRAVIEQFPHASEHVFTLKEFIYDDPTTLEKIEQLKHHMAQLEMKRAQFNNARKQGDVNEGELNAQLEPEQRAINRLVREIPSFDIGDPYGGNIDLYEMTLKEIEEAIDLLLKKLDRQG